jgi:6-phosphofructokinase
VIYQSIGREAGWLAASSAMAKRIADDAPHILCLPERKFDKTKFLADVKRVYDRIGWVSIVCGEGITFADGTPVSAAQTRDKFNNVEFGAMGGSSAAIAIHKMIHDEFGFRGEFQVTESLPMSAADRAVGLDIEEAAMCGRKAVELAANGQTGVMVTLVREGKGKYNCITGTIPLKEVAVHAKPMTDKYINAEGNFVTHEFIEYMRPLIGEMPQYANLSYKPYKN